MNLEIAEQFGKASGNLKYLIRKCNNNEVKETLLETRDLVNEIFKKLNK